MVFAELGEFQEVENGTREDSRKVQDRWEDCEV